MWPANSFVLYKKPLKKLNKLFKDLIGQPLSTLAEIVYQLGLESKTQVIYPKKML